MNLLQSSPVKKEMLTVSRLEDGRTKVKINYSSLDLLNTCLRKAKYKLLDEYENKDEGAPPLVFGSAIHKGLESWYSIPVEKRRIPKDIGKEILHTKMCQVAEDTLTYPAVNALLAFINASGGLSYGMDDKRSIDNGLKILLAYFDHYANDGLVICSDAQGPLIERGFSFIMHESSTLVIEYFGTVDCVLKNEDTGTIFVADHKTTSSLGAQFYNRIKPNHQYTGYVLGAKQCFGLDTSTFMVNGIQVAKTKCEFARQFTDRTEEDFEELRKAVISTVHKWLETTTLGDFPMNSPSACGTYGACQYMDLCSTPAQMHKTIIQAKWPKKESL